MLFNFFKIGFRNILRNKVRTIIHVLGLSIGIAICFLIFNVNWFAYSFDSFHEDVDQIYRVTTTSYFVEDEYPNSGVPGPLAQVIQDEVKGIEDKTTFYYLYQTMVLLPEQNKSMGRNNETAFMEPSYFRFFDYEWLAGNPETALENPNSVVLAESQASSYFPNTTWDEILGRELIFYTQDSIPATVTGIVKDLESNSNFIFKNFISFATIEGSELKNWYGIDSWTNVNSSNQLFIKKSKDVSVESVLSDIMTVTEKNTDFEEGSSRSHDMHPLSEMHFEGTYNNQGVSRSFLQGMVVIGVIILVLACLNFINLETAQSINRSKEVGIRKTLGSNRVQLVFQFLTETLLIVIIATLLGMGLVQVLSLAFEDYLPGGFHLTLITAPNVAFIIGFVVVLTLISGLYPALILGGYQAQRALMGEVKQSHKFSLGIFLRKNLTVLQFASSITFIILVSAISYQMSFLSNRPLGFDKAAVVYLEIPFMANTDKVEQLTDRVRQQTFVSGASPSNDLVSSTSLWTSDLMMQKDNAESELYVQVKNADSAFVGVNGLRLLAGNVHNNSPAEVLINETLSKEMGFEDPSEAIGQPLTFNEIPRKVAGVINDYHSRTLREEIRPMLIFYDPEYVQKLNVKLSGDQNLAMAKTQLEGLFKEYFPLETTELKFLDDEIERFYLQDVKIRNILAWACGLAILISCLGLFGLSSFTIAQRTKEISIRKVLGASLGQILFLISKEYIFLVGISFLLAIYPAYYFLNDWLQDFENRINMPYIMFLLSGLGVLLICLLIVGSHSYFASRENPAKVLKSE
ncbi:ABC transporter permease [Algoriphagus sediminis]|uniref:ABC transporter permease n=1 Tax=Algoriphagus sediminis TaxID=3057113 RepID=A0ABT7Y9Y1_9BACT|nr:ABC transporter permease [Algoriphagus sediminis]MDN3203330.1 ABC transporter permease [Algoriphagus sediminis]